MTPFTITENSGVAGFFNFLLRACRATRGVLARDLVRYATKRKHTANPWLLNFRLAEKVFLVSEKRL